jgi:hypothetical protein
VTDLDLARALEPFANFGDNFTFADFENPPRGFMAGR